MEATSPSYNQIPKLDKFWLGRIYLLSQPAPAEMQLIQTDSWEPIVLSFACIESVSCIHGVLGVIPTGRTCCCHGIYFAFFSWAVLLECSSISASLMIWDGCIILRDSLLFKTLKKQWISKFVVPQIHGTQSSMYLSNFESSRSCHVWYTWLGFLQTSGINGCFLWKRNVSHFSLAQLEFCRLKVIQCYSMSNHSTFESSKITIWLLCW